MKGVPDRGGGEMGQMEGQWGGRGGEEGRCKG